MNVNMNVYDTNTYIYIYMYVCTYILCYNAGIAATGALFFGNRDQVFRHAPTALMMRPILFCGTPKNSAFLAKCLNVWDLENDEPLQFGIFEQRWCVRSFFFQVAEWLELNAEGWTVKSQAEAPRWIGITLKNYISLIIWRYNIIFIKLPPILAHPFFCHDKHLVFVDTISVDIIFNNRDPRKLWDGISMSNPIYLLTFFFYEECQNVQTFGINQSFGSI